MARNGNQIARKISEHAEFEELLIKSLFSQAKNIRCAAVTLLDSLLKLGIANVLTKKLLQPMMEDIQTFWKIIYRFFEISENSSDQCERFRSVVKSIPKSSPAYLPFINLLIQKSFYTQKCADLSRFSEMFPNFDDLDWDRQTLGFFLFARHDAFNFLFVFNFTKV